MVKTMMLRAGVLALCCAVSAVAGAAERDEALLRCRALKAADERLNCYDAIPLTPTARSEWGGRNGTDDFKFSAKAGDQLVIEHNDVILVGTLKDPSGKLLENLHLAGRGTLKVALREDGDYLVTLSATGSWTARLQRAP